MSRNLGWVGGLEKWLMMRWSLAWEMEATGGTIEMVECEGGGDGGE
jgi:hypothetical protein